MDVLRKYDSRGRPVRTADLLAIIHATPEQIARTGSEELGSWITGLTFAMRRERNKSLANHRAYDLDRHIALKRARDRFRDEIAARAQRRPEK